MQLKTNRRFYFSFVSESYISAFFPSAFFSLVTFWQTCWKFLQQQHEALCILQHSNQELLILLPLSSEWECVSRETAFWKGKSETTRWFCALFAKISAGCVNHPGLTRQNMKTAPARKILMRLREFMPGRKKYALLLLHLDCPPNEASRMRLWYRSALFSSYFFFAATKKEKAFFVWLVSLCSLIARTKAQENNPQSSFSVAGTSMMLFCFLCFFSLVAKSAIVIYRYINSFSWSKKRVSPNDFEKSHVQCTV